MPELLHETDRKRIATEIKNRIEEWCAVHYDDGHRSHLGASMIGKKCNRFLWYSFRWVFHEQHSGRIQRLFNRGHLEENRIVEWLRAAGCKVWDTDENGQQYRISDVNGHFGGSMDGGMLLPPEFYSSGILAEFKTHNTKSFSRLMDIGNVKEAKPEHYAQMCTYGYKQGLKYGLYFAINKNDDDIYIELVELDWKHGEEMLRKATYVIEQQAPPPRLHENPSHFDCKLCPASAICHESKEYLMNCRSCVYAVPVANKEWHCKRYGQNIPKDFIPKGCAQWHPIGRLDA